jgi:hypothetical protein
MRAWAICGDKGGLWRLWGTVSTVLLVGRGWHALCKTRSSFSRLVLGWLCAVIESGCGHLLGASALWERDVEAYRTWQDFCHGRETGPP